MSVKRPLSSRVSSKLPTVEVLETRIAPAAAFAQFVDPHPSPGNSFGFGVAVLPNGNVVITSPFDDTGGTDAGAIYLFNGTTGALISEIHGSHANDKVGLGEVFVVGSGNFVVPCPEWDNGAIVDAGAVVFGNGTTGVSGTVSPTNSLVGTSANDFVGSGGVTVLSNGNYVVGSIAWHSGVNNVGAATWGGGATGIVGAVGPANSLVGSTNNDLIGAKVVALSNGNYVVASDIWDNGAIIDAGSVTLGLGNTGTSGIISSANSLVGTLSGDQVGFAITSLPGGNFVVQSKFWDNGAVSDAGAATWVSGATGLTGSVTPGNSLVGTNAGDSIGANIRVLSNGNYVAYSSSWNGGVGAATWAPGASGITGGVSAANSLVGTVAGDSVGFGVIALTNGKYLVLSPDWSNGAVGGAGAATLGGTSGIVGQVSAANSLVGTLGSDRVGTFGYALSNGNYVVTSPAWNGGLGAVTFGDGTAGITGQVTSLNSLVGSTAADGIGTEVVPLSNGNYVVRSPGWDNGAISDAGAATWGSGTTGITGTVSAANSLVGTTANDQVGQKIVALTNGNYVVLSPNWNGNVTSGGAATFGDGATGISGGVSTANSIFGTNPNDRVGSAATALSNGNYVVQSPFWNGSRGGVTLVNGSSGNVGAVTAGNSLTGSTGGDQIGGDFSGPAIIPLSNGNFVVKSDFWDNGALADAGAITFGSGTVGVVGVIDSSNSALGAAANGGLSRIFLDETVNIFFGTFDLEGGGVIRVGSTIDGFAVSAADTDVTLLNGNLVITDINGGASLDSVTVARFGTSIRISDPDLVLNAGAGTVQVDSRTVDVPFSAVTAQIIVDLLGGDDTLTIDFSAGNPLPALGILYIGGAQQTAAGDGVEVAGGGQGIVTYTFTSASGGTVNFGNFGLLTFSEVSSFYNVGSQTAMEVVLPALQSTVRLEDNGIQGDSLSRFSAADSFGIQTAPSIQFTDPADALTLTKDQTAIAAVVDALTDFTGSLIMGGPTTPFEQITFGGKVALSADSDLSAYAKTSISVLGGVQLSTSGIGGISLIAGRSVNAGAGSQLTVVDGIVSLAANTGPTRATGASIGIDLDGAVLRATGAGAVNLEGRGGTGSTAEYGVSLRGGALVSGGTGPGAGTSVIGEGGGTATGFASIGVLVSDGTITSLGGNVFVSGTGGAVGNLGEASGVYLAGASALVTSGGTGTVTVTGSGGGASAATNTGVDVRLGALLSSGGDLSVTGVGGANASSVNIGVRAIAGGIIRAGGTGTLTIDGTAGAGTQNGTVAISVDGAGSTFETLAGTITIDANVQQDDVFGLRIEGGGRIGSGNNSSITIRTDSLDLQSGTVDSGTGLTLIATAALNGRILLGANDVLNGSFALGVSNAEISQINAGTIRFGDNNTASLEIVGGVNVAHNLALKANNLIASDQPLSLGAGLGLQLISSAALVDLNAPVLMSGAMLISVGTGDVFIDDPGNSLGRVNIGSAGRVFLRSDPGLVIGTSNISQLLSIESAGTVTQNGTLVGAGGLLKLGTGTFVASLANSYAGTTEVAEGTFQLDAIGAPGDYVLSGGTLAFNLGNTPVSFTRNIILEENSTIDVAGGGEVSVVNPITGPAGFTKTGGGTLVLESSNNSFGPAPVNVSGGTLQVASDGALGDVGNPLILQTATLRTTATFASGRDVTLASGQTTFEINASSLTLLGAITGPGNQVVTGSGQLLTSLVYTGGDVTPQDGKTVSVGNTFVSVTSADFIVHLVDGNPNKIDTIEVKDVTAKTKLVITSDDGQPVTINRIIITDPTEATASILLGPGVTIGDGVRDSVPDVLVTGSVKKLQFDAINSYALISIGTLLPYDAAGGKTPDTYNNKPDLKVRTVNGPGVVFDLSGGVFNAPGGAGQPGGGGLGKVSFDEWAFPGAIRTTQSIKSFTLKNGDCQVVFSVDRFKVGALTTAGVGTMTVPKGAWASTGSVIEGGIKKMSVKDFLDGADLTVGSLGVFNVDGDFSGYVQSENEMKSINVKGRFKGSLQGKAIGKLSAEYFDGTVAGKTDTYGDPSRHNIVCTDGNLGMISIKPLAGDSYGLKNFEIVVAKKFDGISIAGKTTDSDFIGLDQVVVKAGSIGSTTVKVTGAEVAIRKSAFESSAEMGAVTTVGGVKDSVFAAFTSIAQVTVGGAMSGSKVLAGTFLGDDAAVGGLGSAADEFNRGGTIAGVKVTGAMTSSTIAAGIDSVDGIYGNGDDILSTAGTPLAGKTPAIGTIVLGQGSGTVGTGPTGKHLNAIMGASFKSVTIGKTALKPLPGMLPVFLDLGTSGEDLSDVLVKVLN